MPENKSLTDAAREFLEAEQQIHNITGLPRTAYELMSAFVDQISKERVKEAMTKLLRDSSERIDADIATAFKDADRMIGDGLEIGDKGGLRFVLANTIVRGMQMRDAMLKKQFAEEIGGTDGRS